MLQFFQCTVTVFKLFFHFHIILYIYLLKLHKQVVQRHNHFAPVHPVFLCGQIKQNQKYVSE